MNTNMIKKFRMEKGWNQKEFAELMDMDRSYLSQIENGHAKPSLSLLEKIAAKLEKNLKDFF